MFTIKSTHKTYFFVLSFLFLNFFLQADNKFSKEDLLKEQLKSCPIDSVQDSSQNLSKKNERFEQLLQSMQKSKKKISHLIETCKAKIHKGTSDFGLLLVDGFDEEKQHQKYVDEEKTHILKTIAMGGTSGSSSGDGSSDFNGQQVSVDDDDYNSRTSKSGNTESTNTDVPSSGRLTSSSSDDYFTGSDDSDYSSSSDVEIKPVENARKKFELIKQMQNENFQKRAVKLQQYGYAFQKPQALSSELNKLKEKYQKAKDTWALFDKGLEPIEIEIIETEIKILQAQDLFEQNALKEIEQNEKKEVEAGKVFLAEYGYQFQPSDELAQQLKKTQNELEKAEQVCKDVYFFPWQEDLLKVRQEKEKLANIEQMMFDMQLNLQTAIIIQLRDVLALQAQLPKKVKADTKECDQFKKKLMLALVLATRKDLAVTIDRDVVCEDDSVMKNKQTRPGEELRLYSLSAAYITSNLFIQAMGQSGYMVDNRKKGWSYTIQFVQPIVHLQKDMQAMHQNNTNNVFLVMSEQQKREKIDTDMHEGLRQLSRLANNVIEPIFARTVMAAMSYNYFDTDYKVITLVDEWGGARHFLLPKNVSRLPREIVLDNTDQKWRDAIEQQIKKSDDRYNQQLQKAQKELDRLDKNSDVIAKKLDKKGIESLDHQLPQNFQAACNAQGKPLRDETGAYFNTQGEKCVWDADKKHWDTTTLHGSHIYQKPSVSNTVTQTNADATPAKGATVFDHPKIDNIESGQGCAIPVPPQEKHEQQGCGDVNSVDRPTHTAHGAGETTSAKNTGHDKVEGVETSTVFQGRKDNSKTKNDAKPIDVEPKKGTPEWDKKYPNGKYRPSAKHHENSPEDIGKPPRDGQAALDNSFSVEKSRERIAVQDGEVVILKYEEKGVYHGYIHEDVKGLSQKVKDALVKNGYMKDATSKKLIKKVD